MARFALTDFACSVIQPLLPTQVRGAPRVDDRRFRMALSGGCEQARPGPTSLLTEGPHHLALKLTQSQAHNAPSAMALLSAMGPGRSCWLTA